MVALFRLDSGLLTDSVANSWLVATTLGDFNSDSDSRLLPDFQSRGGAVPTPTPHCRLLTNSDSWLVATTPGNSDSAPLDERQFSNSRPEF